MSQWLYAALREAGFDTVLLETRHVKAALSAMTVKTDRKDARGIAQLLRMGWFRPVHCKSLGSQEVRALLTARKLLLGKLIDVESSLRGILRGFGLKMGVVTRKTYDARARELAAGQPMLETVISAMLAARMALLAEYGKLHKALLAIVHDDAVCHRLMSVPGVGPVVAVTFKTAVDDPMRITRSRAIGPLFALTPRKYQSGETDVTGHVSCVGDAAVRNTLYEAANNPAVAGEAVFGTQALGNGNRQTARPEARESGARSQDRRDHASHVGRRNRVPLDGGGTRGGVRRGERNKGFAALERASCPKSRRRDDGSGKAVRTQAAIVLVRLRFLDRLAVSF